MPTEDMLAANTTSKMLDVQTLLIPGYGLIPGYDLAASRMYASAVAQNLTRLNVSDCINAYATDFQTSRGSLILAIENSTKYRICLRLQNASRPCKLR